MNKSGRIALLMVLLALIFAAIGAVAVKFKLTALFMVGWAGVALCVWWALWRSFRQFSFNFAPITATPQRHPRLQQDPADWLAPLRAK
jgi:hypothetical protein